MMTALGIRGYWLRTSRPRLSPPLLTLLFFALLTPATPPPLQAALIWTDDDWSGANYIETTGIDPEIHPGLLVLEQRLDDMRFVGQPTFFQGIYALAVYHDTLYVGCGHYPILADGCHILAYDYYIDSFSLVYEPYEQGVICMKVYGDTLYVPGADSRGSHDWGNLYLYNGQDWIRKETVPNAVHLFDVAVMDNVIYTTTGDRYGDAVLFSSDDGGNTFTEIFRIPRSGEHPVRRFFGCETYKDKVYFQPDGFDPQDEMLFTFNGAGWDTLIVADMPVDWQGFFMEWGDSLFYLEKNKMFIYDGNTWIRSWLPFEGNRWCRGFITYRDTLFGGADAGKLYKWMPDMYWTLVTEVGLDPATEEIEALAQHYGRLYISTSRPDTLHYGRLYVSASVPAGHLESLTHDFFSATLGGHISWDAFVPGAGSTLRFQIRSGTSLMELFENPFVGPDGTEESYYEVSGTALHDTHYGDRFFQYAVELLSPDGYEMPFLRSVTLTVETDPTSVELPDDSRSSESGAGGGGAGGMRLCFGPPYPSPARSCATVEVVLGSGLGTGFGSGPPDLDRHEQAQVPLLIRVLDVQGRLVRLARVACPVDSRTRWTWDLRDASGHPVTAGVYKVSVEATTSERSAASTQKIVVLR